MNEIIFVLFISILGVFILSKTKIPFKFLYSLYNTRIGFTIYKFLFIHEDAHKSLHTNVRNPIDNLGEGIEIWCLPFANDNYSYLIIDKTLDENKPIAIAVDPADPYIVLSTLRQTNAELVCVLTTHKHWDHAGGNEILAKAIPDLEIVGPMHEKVLGQTKGVTDGDILVFGNVEIAPMHAPTHTKGHICYFIKGTSQTPSLFSGDTLFIGGVGKFFEGDGSTMLQTLKKILTIPKDTKIYCGHEYTVSNLTFGNNIEPTNKDIIEKLEWAKERRAKKLPTVPSTLREEIKTNVFLRTNVLAVQLMTKENEEAKVLQKLREFKDNFTNK